jgi:hypothetical protein
MRTNAATDGHGAHGATYGFPFLAASIPKSRRNRYQGSQPGVMHCASTPVLFPYFSKPALRAATSIAA